MNQGCVVCGRWYWEDDDFPPYGKIFICPECRHLGYIVKITASDNTGDNKELGGK